MWWRARRRLKAEQEQEDADRAEMVGQWQTVFDDAYEAGDSVRASWAGTAATRASPSLKGRCRVASVTMDRIDSLRPERVLEIGMRSRSAGAASGARCAVYCGTDVSAAAIGGLRRWLEGQPELRMSS